MTANARRAAPIRKEPVGPRLIQPGNALLYWDEAARKLTVEIDCSEGAIRAALASKSGKSRILASTSGFWSIPLETAGLSGLQLSLTATLPAGS
ncbi:MAG: hypothetical protein VW405_01295 [Rhodospirillaceae bacterium]